jgi:hypothetical protein
VEKSLNDFYFDKLAQSRVLLREFYINGGLYSRLLSHVLDK